VADCGRVERVAHGVSPPGTLLARIRAGEAVYGTFVSLGSPAATEIVARSGLDWLVVDLEHGAGGESALLSLLQAARSGGDAAAIVRVESAARLRIGRALDLGAAGVMLPRVDTADEARSAMRWMRYPPEGERGVALMARSGGYGTIRDGDVGSVNEQLVGVVQIETPLALEGVDGIAAEDGADVLFVGPTDLSHTLGVPGDLASQRFTDALDRVVAAARASGKCAGILARSVDDVPGYLERGFRFIGVGSDAALLSVQMRRLAADLRSAAHGTS
jgi:4-hydroxy-2-oxoheptanedioate aldolase